MYRDTLTGPILRLCRRIVVSPPGGFYRIILLYSCWGDRRRLNAVGPTNLCLQAPVNGNKSGNDIEYLEYVKLSAVVLNQTRLTTVV